MLISLSTHCGCRAAFPTWAIIIPFLQWWGGRKHWAGKVNSHVCGYAVCNHRQVTSPPCPPALFICFDTLWSTDCLFPGQPWCGFPLMASLILWESLRAMCGCSCPAGCPRAERRLDRWGRGSSHNYSVQLPSRNLADAMWKLSPLQHNRHRGTVWNAPSASFCNLWSRVC